MRFDIADLNGSGICAGVEDGRAVLTGLLSATPHNLPTNEIVYLDFSGVEVATVSFLRESVSAYRRVIRERRPAIYAVVANPNSKVQEEIGVVARFESEVVLCCILSSAGAASESFLIGQLEPKQQMTFDLVIARGETDASELYRDFESTDAVKQTAWNNRLSALAAQGLVSESTAGRTKRYRPLLIGE